MSQKHEVSQGEDLLTICRQHGIPVDKVKAHSANQELWSDHRDEEILNPGDVLELPDIETRVESAATGARARFRYKLSGKAELILRLVDVEGPRMNVGYVITADNLTIDGKTDGDGLLKANVPVDTKSAMLRIEDTGEEYELQVAHLNPAASNSGAMQRLKNLGYYGGDVDDDASPRFSAAIRRFQADRGLDDTGEYDSETRAKLIEVHGC